MQFRAMLGDIPDLEDFHLQVLRRILHRQQDFESVFLFLLLTAKGKGKGKKQKQKKKREKTFSDSQIFCTFNSKLNVKTELLAGC